MLFPRAAVVGIGLIGGSFALAAKRAGLVGHVTGVARSEATRQGALKIGAADAVTSDAASAVAEADLVYLAAPIDSICGSLRTLGPHLRSGALVTDAGSAKTVILDAARALPPTVTFLGGHPMAGSEQAGIASARADLFAGSSYFLTPTPDTPADAVETLSALVSGLGARPVIVEAALHDRLVALTSHLPHLLAWALCTTAGEAADPAVLAPFLGGAWRDVTRIAGSSPEMWSEIFRANFAPLQSAAASLSAELNAAQAALDLEDPSAFLDWLHAARTAHERLRPS
jgi:prephenate dehydrogenase